MILASFILTQIEISGRVEAALQNFAAGLILAAGNYPLSFPFSSHVFILVSAELFPVMTDSNELPSYIGISVGFFIGLSTIYGLEHLVEYIEATPEEDLFGGIKRRINFIKTFPKGYESASHDSDDISDLKQPFAGWEESDVERASKAIGNSKHRDHIAEHLDEVLQIIKTIEVKSTTLSGEEPLDVPTQEELAEQIDECIHSLQYKLDHARRLLQGSETNNSSTPEALVSSWVTGERKAHIEKNINGLRLTVEHLLEHIQEPNLDKDVVREMRIHMDHMDKQISLFHESIETAAAKWHRSLPKIATNEGDKLPMGLILPVCLDCFVDGFLIGITSVVSLKAGIILSFANCLEMSFLGMAYSARLKKCTGSSFCARLTALYGPPWIMFLAAGLGAALGSLVEHIPAIFIGMVAFGTGKCSLLSYFE
jgi:zinc transporter ZupT